MRKTTWNFNGIQAFLSVATAAVVGGAVLFGAAAQGAESKGAKPLPRLKVSENGRFLTTEDGAPFFWLGDTAWELFHRLNREEVIRYLDNRQERGFTVVQAVAVAELEGPKEPNAYGFLPFKDLKSVEPATVPGPNNDYWDQVDFVVDEANKRGIYVGFLPTWGRWWKKDQGGFFNPENAERYGRWLGERYRDKGIVWILGGDRNIDNDEERATVVAMARGLRQGDGGAHLCTFHPRGGGSSADYFHDDDWLDFNMRQNGHGVEYGTYDGTRREYERTPVKPIIDGEPVYEDHPVAFNPDNLGHTTAADVRRPLYWDLFNGAFGHTYGCHSIWQMFDPEDPAQWEVNRPLTSWREGIEAPGAAQMQHGKALIESRPFLTRIPDMSLIVADRIQSSIPGAGTRRFAATRDEAGTYAFVYVPLGREFTVKTEALNAKKIRAHWFDPRTGEARLIGEFENTGERSFLPPTPGETLDWVLVLDDASKNYPKPGAKKWSGNR
ncbi:MAG: glycoside hydrolase family 140 protein [Thermoguttaceae bacterium]|nr:glycoside hydrolase family 140 protein [Thermoguttaceae bacterium]